jgi:hypothetical protein
MSMDVSDVVVVVWNKTFGSSYEWKLEVISTLSNINNLFVSISKAIIKFHHIQQQLVCFHNASTCNQFGVITQIGATTNVMIVYFLTFRNGDLIRFWKYNVFSIVRFLLYHWNMWINLKNLQWIKNSQKHS